MKMTEIVLSTIYIKIISQLNKLYTFYNFYANCIHFIVDYLNVITLNVVDENVVHYR